MFDLSMVIYGQSSWVLFDMSGKQIEKKKTLREVPILQMIMMGKDDYTIIHWSGDMAKPEMAIVTCKVFFIK